MMQQPMPQQGMGMMPQDYPMPDNMPNFSSPMMDRTGNIMLMTSTKEELDNLKLVLRNQIKDDKGRILQIGKPLLNEKGVTAVIGMVQSLMHRVTIMSSLKEREIGMLMLEVADSLNYILMLNRVNFEIKDQSSRISIHHNALMHVYVTLKRAENNGDRQFWKGSQQEITTRLESNAERNRSLFSKATNWFWGGGK